MLFKKCVPLLCCIVFCGLVYCVEGRTCEQRLSNLANGYRNGSGLLDVSIDCIGNNIDFTYSSFWYQLEFKCWRKNTSENVVFKTIGQFVSFDDNTQNINIPEISYSNDPTVECVIGGCGTTNDYYFEIPATTVDCLFNNSRNKIVINEDALVANNTLAISWDPLQLKHGGIYLTSYLVKITSVSLLQEYSETLSSRNETKMVWKTSFEYQFDVQPFTRYTVQVFAELNHNDIPEILITPPVTVVTPESIPSEPFNFTALPSFTNVTLKWERPENPNGIITSYKIAQTYIRSGKNVEFNTPDTMFIVKRLSPGENYLFRVSAFTTAGEGPTAIVNVTTTTGVIPPVIAEVTEIRENVVSIIIEPISTELGPSSHYFVIVKQGSLSHTEDSADVDTRTLLPYTDHRWKYYGYYVAAVYEASSDDSVILIGDNSTTVYQDIKYMNGPLEKGAEFKFFIRLFSKTSPNIYKDSLFSTTISILDDEVNSKPLCAEPSKADQLSVCIFILLTFTSASVYTIINP